MRKYLILLMVLSLSCPNLAAREDDISIRENLDKAYDNLSKDPAKAIYFAKNALTLATSSKSPDTVAEAQYLIACSYINIGDYVSSYDYLVEAERNCPSENRRLKADILLSISYSYQKVRDFDNAFKYLGIAKEIFRELDDTASIARCANNEGLIYTALPDNETAGKYFEESLRLNRAIGNKTGIAQNLNNMSFIDGDPLETISRLKEAILINESLERTWVLGENYNNLGFQYRRAGDCESALEALAKARNYADMTNANELIMDNFRYRSEIYAMMGEFDKAYSDVKSLLDMLESQDMSVGLKDIELGLMEKTLQAIRNEKERQEKEYRMKRAVSVSVMALLAVICTIIIITYNLYRKNARKQKELMKRELDLKKKELDNFALYVKSRNDILSTIQKKIRDVYGLESSEATRELKKINSNISQFNRTNDEAEKMIDEVNSGFIAKLSERYPDLTNSEKRLASLLRIGMSSKEISLIMSMEPKSVDMARYHLRKKLNLTASDNICDFLGKI